MEKLTEIIQTLWKDEMISSHAYAELLNFTNTHQALQLLQSRVIESVCDDCKNVTGFYLGTTCSKCNRPFRDVKQTEL